MLCKAQHEFVPVRRNTHGLRECAQTRMNSLEEERCLDNQEKQIETGILKEVEETYGIPIDLSLTIDQNTVLAISHTPMEIYCSIPQKLVFRDQTFGKMMPKAIKSILGLSHKFIPTPAKTPPLNKEQLDIF